MTDEDRPARLDVSERERTVKWPTSIASKPESETFGLSRIRNDLSNALLVEDRASQHAMCDDGRDIGANRCVRSDHARRTERVQLRYMVETLATSSTRTQDIELPIHTHKHHRRSRVGDVCKGVGEE